MRVLLVATNREKAPFPVSPVGVLAVAGAALAAGHDVDLIDMMFQAAPTRRLRTALRAKQYDVVALGIRNLDNCFWAAPKHFFDDVKGLVRDGPPLHDRTDRARRTPASPSSRRAGSRASTSTTDVVGEGEAAFVALLDAIAAGRSPDGIAGVTSAGTIARRRPRPAA
jgi:hypothetical protein